MIPSTLKILDLAYLIIYHRRCNASPYVVIDVLYILQIFEHID